MLTENIQQYQEWISTLPDAVQWLAIILLSAVPYVELHVAAVIGMLAGLNPALSIIVSALGNFTAILFCVMFAEKLNKKFGKPEEELSKRRQKFNKNFEKYGVAGVSILGWLLLPSTITSFLMITTAKVPKAKVLFWMAISLIIWSIALGCAAFLIFNI